MPGAPIAIEPLPRSCDVVVSFVLYRTGPAEAQAAVEQALASSGLDLHVVVVDNSETPVPLPAFDPDRVTRVRSGANLGYGRAHNIAIAASAGRCRYHFVLNTDLRFGPEVIPALVSYMDARPEIGLAMPRVVYPDGRVQQLCRLLPDPLLLLGRRFFPSSRYVRERNRDYEFHDWSYDREASFPFLSGCFMAIRRSVLDRVGGFDPRYFLYAEDLDLSRRIHAVADTRFAPVATVEHGYRTQSARSWRLTRYALVSLARYFSKWGWLVDRERDAVNRACNEALRQPARQNEPERIA